jgi:hypothetical protein
MRPESKSRLHPITIALKECYRCVEARIDIYHFALSPRIWLHSLELSAELRLAVGGREALLTKLSRSSWRMVRAQTWHVNAHRKLSWQTGKVLYDV